MIVPAAPLNAPSNVPSDQRILLTGATGFIGSALCRRLVDAGNPVTILVRPGSDHSRLTGLSGDLTIAETDMADSDQVTELVNRAAPDIVFHLASSVFNPPGLTAAEHLDANVRGTLFLLEALKTRPDCKFIYTGSAAEYPPGNLLSEDLKPGPVNVYGAMKACASLLIDTYARTYGHRTARAVLFTVYGPGEAPHRLVPSTIRSALQGHSVRLKDGSVQRDLLFIDDAIDGLCTMAATDLAPGSVINLCTGTGTPVRTIANIIVRLTGATSAIEEHPEETRPDEIRIVSGETMRARDLLKWQPQWSLEAGLAKTIQRYSDPNFPTETIEGRRPPGTTETEERLMTETISAASPCLVCRDRAVGIVLDLGETAPANNFVLPEELEHLEEKMFPLRLGLCRTCGHVQLTDFVPPEIMFDHYLYMSSASSTLTGHLRDLARTVTTRLGLQPQDLVVDIGCNDGSLLEGFALAGLQRRIGVDPAENLAHAARQRGADVVTAYFSPEIADWIREQHGRAAAMTMTNTFPHVPDLQSLLRSFDALLSDDGVLVLEAHYLVDLMQMCAFDTIYHEHVSYWALGPMVRLFRDYGFEVFDVERLPIHHGQLRAWVGRAGRHEMSDRVADLLAEERIAQLDRIAPYQQMAAQIQGIKTDLLDLIRTVRAGGGRVVGYGAPAKGSTLLSFFDIGPEELDYIADRNVLKQGRFTPGSHIPIVAPDRIFDDQPELVLVLAWNFAEEIANQLSAYVEAGGRLVVPIPTVSEIAVSEIGTGEIGAGE